MSACLITAPGIGRVDGVHRYADRAGERRCLIAQTKRRKEGFAHACDDVHDLEGRLVRVETGKNDHEFVAAEARNSVRLAHRAGQSLRDRLQQLIARIVAKRIVDAFEVIEVEEEARHLVPVARRLSNDLPEPLVEQCAVRKAGENIVLRELVCLRGCDLQLLGALGDLLLEGALIGRDLGLRFEQAVRHMIEGVR